MHAGAVSDF